MDEVGRGALAGPVTVGVVLVTAASAPAPRGVRDSKDLRPAAREALLPALRAWAHAWGVGHSEAHEVDALGITRALRLAGERALAAAGCAPDAVVLDGAHDYLTRSAPAPARLRPATVAQPPPLVVTQVRADSTCSAVAAASVLAKTERDALMAVRGRAHPRFGWASNAGYGAPAHLAALTDHGPCAEHRLTWRLPFAATRAGADAPSGRALRPGGA